VGLYVTNPNVLFIMFFGVTASSIGNMLIGFLNKQKKNIQLFLSISARISYTHICDMY